MLWRTFLASNCVFFSIRALSLLKKNKEENTVTYQESPPWLLTMFKTPCVEIILYPEFSRSNRQANKSSRTMDAGNHRLLQTSSPAYYSFLETTENYTLQIQRKNQVCSSPRVPLPRVPLPRVPLPRVPLPRVPLPRVPLPRVPLPRVSRYRVHVPESQSPSPSPHVSVPTSQSPRLSPHVSVPTSQSPRLSLTFSHSPKSLICGETWFTYQTCPRHQ